MSNPFLPHLNAVFYSFSLNELIFIVLCHSNRLKALLDNVPYTWFETSEMFFFTAMYLFGERMGYSEACRIYDFSFHGKLVEA